LYLNKKYFRAYILYANKKPCAFEFGSKYGPIFFPHSISYDPNLKKGSPGTILFVRVFEALIKDPDIKIFDFGFGNSLYKERFGTDCWQESIVYIYAHRFYPILVNIITSFLRGLSLLISYLVRKLGLFRKIKNYWRAKLLR